MRSPHDQPLLSLHAVCVEQEGHKILDQVSFSVKKGEIVSIIGPNGAGKTTLIRAMLGLVPYTGTILFRQKSVHQSLAHIGYVPQRFDFDKTFPISVCEFLDLFPHTVRGRDEKKICEELRISSFLQKKLGDLSGGQLQRVLIAQALLKNPELLILDEPTSGVDVEGIKNFYEIVEHLHQDHDATILLISHELTMVYRFATTVVCLNRNLVCFGPPSAALTPDVMARLYGKDFQPREHAHPHP